MIAELHDCLPVWRLVREPRPSKEEAEREMRKEKEKVGRGLEERDRGGMIRAEERE